MKPLSPNDPHHDAFDDLMMAALNGELSPEERAQFDSRLQNDPAARAAYLEAQAMHDLLEKTHKSAQPDPAFEQRMVSGVRRKLETEKHQETAWESVVALWSGLRRMVGGWPLWQYGALCSTVFVLALTFLIYQGDQVKSVFTTISGQLAVASAGGPAPIDDIEATKSPSSAVTATTPSPRDARLDRLEKEEANYRTELQQQPYNQIAAKKLAHIEAEKARFADSDEIMDSSQKLVADKKWSEHATAQTNLNFVDAPANGYAGAAFAAKAAAPPFNSPGDANSSFPREKAVEVSPSAPAATDSSVIVSTTPIAQAAAQPATQAPVLASLETEDQEKKDERLRQIDNSRLMKQIMPADASAPADNNTLQPPASPPAVDTRKLIRNAQLDLEVKSFQDAMNKITALTKAAAGYVDTSNSQKGGNGKLQGTVVAKVLPENLDEFLLRLRDLGQVQNQSVSTDDVTKDYFDTQARLTNSQRMETQLQELLKHENGKVSDLLAVERELGRVRGDIEQMQGQLKLYDFQVQYATITINMREKDLNQSGAYLLKEQDQFSLFATDVEATFQKARKIADDFKAQVLTADLNHNSGSDVSAELLVMVPPDQIEAFLGEVRGLGRVANFTRQTQRVARDGGDSTQPADETLTDKDKVQVQISIRYDNTTAAYLLQERDDFSLFATDVEGAFNQARKIADDMKAQVLGATLNHNSNSDVSAELAVMVAPGDIESFLAQVRSLGRVANFTRQTQRITKDGGAADQTGETATTERDKVQVHITFRSDDETRKQVALTVVAKAVDVALDQAKVAALANAGVSILNSSLNRAAQGQSTAQLAVRVPGKEYGAVMEAFKALGRTAALSIQRNDDSGPGANGDDAPVIISLSLTDDDTPLQETALTVLAADVDAGSQQIKKVATAAGVEVKASSFQHQPDGTEDAQMTFCLPMAKYPTFLASVRELGKVESLSVQRDDRPDQNVADDSAPVQITLDLHNQADVVPDDTGLWSTLRQTFGEGAGALLGSVRTIGVIAAFLTPWLVTLAVLAWAGRRVYVWRKNRAA